MGFGQSRAGARVSHSNGGETWTYEVVSVVAGPVYLARNGKFLTVISAVDQLTLLRYEE